MLGMEPSIFVVPAGQIPKNGERERRAKLKKQLSLRFRSRGSWLLPDRLGSRN